MGRSVFGQPTDFSAVSSASDDGIIATSYEDDYFVRGNGRLINDVITLASGATQTFLFDFSEITGEKRVFLTPFQITSSEEEVSITFYEGTDYSGGTSVTLLNPNRAYSTSTETVVTENSTGTDLGTQLTVHSAFGNSGFLGLNSAGSSSARPLILDTTQKYLIVIENLGTGSTRVEWDLVFFEI